MDLYHKSECRVGIADLAKFNDDWLVRARVSVFSRELKERIDVEMEAMRTAYARLCERMERAHINGEMFEDEVERALHPELVARKKATMTLAERFERFIDDAYRDGMFGEGRMKHYRTVLEALKRFLVISNLKSIAPSEFTADMLMDFRHYVANECEYVGRYAYMYEGMYKHSVPQKPREVNTVISYLKKVQAFFNELEDKGEINASPFRSIGRKNRLAMMKGQPTAPSLPYEMRYLGCLFASSR